MRREICDQYLFIAFPRSFLGRVMQLDSLDMKASKKPSHLRNIIQRQDELCPNFFKLPGQLFKISLAQVMAIEFPSPIWRVQVEERRGTVKASDDLLVWRAF